MLPLKDYNPTTRRAWITLGIIAINVFVYFLVQPHGQANLDPQAQGRIFDALYTTKPGGLGMGLSISRTIVEHHGGRLAVVAQDGPGATFEFTLPAYA